MSRVVSWAMLVVNQIAHQALQILTNREANYARGVLRCVALGFPRTYMSYDSQGERRQMAQHRTLEREPLPYSLLLHVGVHLVLPYMERDVVYGVGNVLVLGVSIWICFWGGSDVVNVKVGGRKSRVGVTSCAK